MTHKLCVCVSVCPVLISFPSRAQSTAKPCSFPTHSYLFLPFLSSGAAASSSSDSDDSDTQPPTKKSLKQRTSKAGKRQAVGEEVAKGVGRLGYRDRAGKLARIAQHEAAEAARLTALLEGHQPQAVTAAGSVGGAGKGAGVAAEASKKAPIVVTLDIPRDPRVKVGDGQRACQLLCATGD